MDPDRAGASLACEVQTSAALAPEEEAELRRLMDSAFPDDFSEADWAHACGGTHIIVRAERKIVAHASVVPRTIWIGPTRLHAGYVEAVAVLPQFQGRGLGTIAMRAVEVVLEGFQVGVLSASRQTFYDRLGWERWKGTSWVRRERQDFRTANDDDAIMVKRTGRAKAFSLDSKIICEERVGDAW